MSGSSRSYQQFFAEWKRRRVCRVMAVYGAVGVGLLTLGCASRGDPRATIDSIRTYSFGYPPGCEYVEVDHMESVARAVSRPSGLTATSGKREMEEVRADEISLRMDESRADAIIFRRVGGVHVSWTLERLSFVRFTDRNCMS